MQRTHHRTGSTVSPQSVASTLPSSNQATLSPCTFSSSDPATWKVETDIPSPNKRKRKKKKTKNACAACKRRRTRCQDARPCEPCVLRNLGCPESNPIAIQTRVDIATQTSLDNAASTDVEELYDFSNSFHSSGVASPHTPGSGPMQTGSSADGLWQLEMCSGCDSPLVFRPGNKIATLSHGNEEQCQPVQIAMQNGSPTFQGRRWLEIQSTYEFLRLDDGEIHGAWRPETGVKFALCAGSTASLPWMYEMLLRCPGMFFGSYDDEYNRLFETVSQLHELELELARNRCFSVYLSQSRSFQSYQTALYLQWREQRLVSCEITNPTFDKLRIKTMCMIGEWLHVASFTHVRTDGFLCHSSEMFRSFAELVDKGWNLRNNIVHVSKACS